MEIFLWKSNTCCLISRLDELLIFRKFIIIKRIEFRTYIEYLFTRNYRSCFILWKHDIYSFLKDIVSVREYSLLPIKRKYWMLKVDLPSQIPHRRYCYDESWRKYLDREIIYKSTIDEVSITWYLGWEDSRDTDRCPNCMRERSIMEYDPLACIDISSIDPKWDTHICESLTFEYLIQEFLHFRSFNQSFFHIEIDKLKPFHNIKDFFYVIWRLTKSQECRDDRTHTRPWECYRNFLKFFESSYDTNMCETTSSATTKCQWKRSMLHNMQYMINKSKYKILSWFFREFPILDIPSIRCFAVVFCLLHNALLCPPLPSSSYLYPLYSLSYGGFGDVKASGIPFRILWWKNMHLSHGKSESFGCSVSAYSWSLWFSGLIHRYRSNIPKKKKHTKTSSSLSISRTRWRQMIYFLVV